MTWVDWVILVVSTLAFLWIVAGCQARRMQIEHWFRTNSSAKREALRQCAIPWWAWLQWLFFLAFFFLKVNLG